MSDESIEESHDDLSNVFRRSGKSNLQKEGTKSEGIGFFGHSMFRIQMQEQNFLGSIAPVLLLRPLIHIRYASNFTLDFDFCYIFWLRFLTGRQSVQF